MEIKQKLITKHFTPRKTNKSVIVDHWSTTKTLQQIYDTFMGERKASAHYGIGSDGEIWQFVPDEFIAWHAGLANHFTLGIEHCGGYLENGERIKPTMACHDASAWLHNHLSKKHGIVISNANVKPHNFYMSTQCPGSLDINYIISKANKMDKTELDLAKEKIDLIDEKYGYKLMKTIDETKPTREEIALIITRLWDAIDKKYRE